MSLLKQLAGETAYYGISSILGRLANYLIVTFYLTQYLTTAEYAIYNEFYIYAAILLLILTFRFETTFFRFAASSEYDRTRVFSTTIFTLGIFGIIAGIIIWWTAPALADALSYTGKEEYVQILGMVIVLDVWSAIPFARLRLLRKAGLFAALKVLHVLINITLIILLFEWWSGWIEEWQEDKLAYIFGANLIASFLLMLYFFPRIFRSKAVIDRKVVVKMLRYAWPLVIVAVAGVMNRDIALIFQKYILGDSITEGLSMAGAYVTALKIAVLLALFTTAFNYAAEPFFFSKMESSEAPAVYARVALAYTAVISVIMIGIITSLDVAELILPAAFTGEFHLVPIILTAFAALGLYYNISIWFKVSDRTIYALYISLIGLGVTVAGNLILIPLAGTLGSAITLCAAYFSMLLTGYMWGQKYYPVPYQKDRILFYLFAGIVLSFLGLAIRQYLPPYSLLLNLLIFVSYTIWIFSKFRKNRF